MKMMISRLFFGSGIAVVLTLALAQTGFAVLATGGNTTTDISGYRIHTFTSSGTLSVSGAGNVEVLVVAGGGGGGADVGGGGGAGGLIYSNMFPVVASNYTVTVGAGGGADLAAGTNGANSVFSSLTAIGGGGGAGWRTGNGSAGGSGGGGYGDSGSGTTVGGASTASGQGNAGGSGFKGTLTSGNAYGAGGGGGGAGAAGDPATSAGGAKGGNGLQYSISGSAVWYAGGGGGSDDPGTHPGTGGQGGGGNGDGTNATANTGGGGGGGGNSNGGRGGNGGSGIVIIRYSTSPVVDNASGATNVTLTSACLNGDLVSTGGAPASVFVYWGTTDGSNSAAAWGNTNMFVDYQPVGPLTTNITGLSSNATYYYRFCATNSFGTGWAPSSAVFVPAGVSVAATDPMGRTDPTDTATFTVSRPAACANGDLIVNYVLGGTATNGTDYTIAPVSGAVVIPQGQANGAIVVTPKFRVDGQRTVSLTLTNGPYVIGSANSDTCTFAAVSDSAGVYTGGSYDGYDSASCIVPIGWPSVNNAMGATNLTDHSACFNGSLLSTGSAPTTVYVYWGPTDGTSNMVSWSNSATFGVCVEGQALSTNVALSPNSAGYYRFFCTNTAGEYAWAIGSAPYATLNPPVITNLAPSVSFTTAILNGRLLAGNSSIVTLYWGQNTNSWANTNAMGTVALGTFAKAISGLSSGAVYYCQWYGTNSFGYGWSATVAFTTRLPYAIYSGGNYDGYDSMAAALTLPVTDRGSVFEIR